MKKLRVLIPILALLMIGYVYKTPITTSVENLLYQSSCDTPISYKIGSIDSRFNLTTQEFLVDIQKASFVWSTPINKNLFIYKPDGEITINLIYDQRQFLNNQINELDTNIKTRQKNLDPEIADYKKRAEEFRSKMNQLNSDIEYWNSKGGAPPDVFELLKNRQAELQQVANKLQQEAASLNQSTAQYNTQVGELRQTVDTFNQALQHEPEEGEYIVANGEKTINIYFVNSKEELIHTLSHELGHALGIGHNANATSIMYPMTSESTTLSPNDLSGLISACEKRSILNNAAIRFSFFIDHLGQRLVK